MKTITLMIFVVSSIAYADKKVIPTNEEAVSAVCKEHESKLETCLAFGPPRHGTAVPMPGPRIPKLTPIQRCQVEALKTKVCQLEAKIDLLVETEIEKALEKIYSNKRGQPHRD